MHISKKFLFIAVIFYLSFLFQNQALCKEQGYAPKKYLSDIDLLEAKPKAPSERLIRLVGIYDDGKKSPASHLVVFEDCGKLFVSIKGKIYLLDEKSDSVFSFLPQNPFKSENAVFEIEKDGKINNLKIGNNTFIKVFTENRIVPLKPIDVLLNDALKASPPVVNKDSYKSDLVDITKLDSSIKLDIRYATSNNFMGTPFYSEPKAFLQRPVAEAVATVNRKIKEYGYGILVYDAYRPWYVTKMFWDATPDNQKDFVADPKKGSMHNRGSAVDLTLYDLKTGKIIEMGSFYDEFGERAYPDFPGGTSLERWHRKFLEFFMEKEGFTVFPYEWWHFNYKDSEKYPVMNTTFERLAEKQSN